MDVTHEAALKAMLLLANDAEMQLFHDKAKNGPLLHIMVAARSDAVAALKELAFVDPTHPEDVRALQNRVRRFDDLVHWVVGILNNGDEAFQELNANGSEAEEIRALIRAQIEDAQHEPGEDQE